MTMESCIPVIPSADLKKTLRFWVEGLGLSVDREMRQDGKLTGCSTIVKFVVDDLYTCRVLSPQFICPPFNLN